MKITYQANNYSPDAVLRRYVRYCRLDKTFHFCEVGEDRRYDLRQGTVKRSELPKDVAQAAIDKCDKWPAYVDWPR